MSNKLKVKKISMVRDIGGIETADGKKIKNGRIYRSSYLFHANKKSIRKIENKLKISKVLDLRSPSEVDAKPDQLRKSNIEYGVYSILDDNQNPSINRKNRKKILYKLSRQEGGTVGSLSQTYREMISSPQAIENFRLLIREILNSDEPLLYHCTQGKDRTGMTTAILLLVLGVDKETIINDYLRYNKYCKFKRFIIRTGVTVALLSRRMALQLNDLLIARIEYIESAFNEIDKEYGSIKNFINEGLELSDDEVECLRRELLTND